MLVARSFTYGPSRQPPAKGARDEKKRQKPQAAKSRKDGEVRGFGWRPESFLRARAESPGAAPAPAACDAPPHEQSAGEPTSSRPSTPVAVPKRPDSAHSSRPSRDAQPNIRSSSSSTGHDPNAVSPSVASLLAMTQIPRRKTFRPPRSYQSLPRRMTPDELREAWIEIDRSTPRSLSPNSYMDVLLTPPDDIDNPIDDMLDEDSADLKLGRSHSDESMPGLDLDNQSVASGLSPPTPKIAARSRFNAHRKRSSAISPPASSSMEDHPLLHRLDLDDDSDHDRDPPTPVPSLRSTRSVSVSSGSSRSSSATSSRPPPAERRPSRFASNLSASISAIRSAAKTISNFAAPSIPPDDHLSRGLFGPAPQHQYRSELRPRPIQGTPTAQLRRYLNPHAFQLHDFHLHNMQIDHTDLALLASYRFNPELLSPEDAVIPLQDYTSMRKTHKVRRAAAANSGEPLFATEAGRALQDGAMQHRREPRENPEFLRICVVEMQMLRAGKIKGPVGINRGRRAFWLPPRQRVLSAPTPTRVSDGRVPERWRGVTIEY